MGKRSFLIGLLMGVLLTVNGQVSVVKNVTFSSNGTNLYGKLIIPGDKGPYPALVFVVGYGGKASYKTSYARFVLENLEIPFVKRDIALFLFDKRGVKPSQGNWASTSLCEGARDVLAAINYLKSQPGIDSTCIGVVGHCEGAWVTQIVAARYPNHISFGVSLAGATVEPRQQLQYQYLSEELCKGVSVDRAQKKAMRKARRTYSLLSAMPVGQYRHLSVICDFKPDSVIKQIQCPFMLLFAQNDALVCPNQNMRRLNEIFPHGVPHNFYVNTIDGANHDFLVAPKCYSGNGIGLVYASEFQNIFVEWIVNQFGWQK